MNEVRIRFIRGSAFDSKVIEWRTRAWCSHVEAIPSVPEPFQSFGAMLSGGVRYRRLSDPVYGGITQKEIWHLPCTTEQYFAFWAFLQKQTGKPYDWRAILAFGWGEHDWEAPDSWFCSELQCAAMKEAGLWRCQGQAHIDRIDPGQAYLLFTSLPGAYLDGSNL